MKSDYAGLGYHHSCYHVHVPPVSVYVAKKQLEGMDTRALLAAAATASCMLRLYCMNHVPCLAANGTETQYP
jgi:hypothetical protein